MDWMTHCVLDVILIDQKELKRKTVQIYISSNLDESRLIAI